MKIASAGLIIALVIVIGFMLSVPHTNDQIQEKTMALVASATVPAVTLHDAYKKGTHTISGSIIIPNPCTSVSVSAESVGDASSTAAITVAIRVPADTGICLQVPLTSKFSTTVNAPADAPITVLVNDTVASTTLE